MGIHDGHRDRMKKQFLRNGADAFNDHQLLELFLFFGKPQGDVNPLAHTLIDHFGSLSAVFDAPPEELTKVKGVGAHVAVLIHLMPQLMRRYELSRMDDTDIMANVSDLGDYFQPYFYGARNEMAYLMSMDGKGKVLGCDRLSEGSLNVTALDSRAVLEAALRRRASCVVLAHNHTSGVARPPREDVAATVQLERILQQIDVILMDHLIIVDGDFVSLRQSKAKPWGWRDSFDEL